MGHRMTSRVASGPSSGCVNQENTVVGSVNLLEEVLRQAPMGLVVVDAAGRLRLVNDAALRIAGVVRDRASAESAKPTGLDPVAPASGDFGPGEPGPHEFDSTGETTRALVEGWFATLGIGGDNQQMRRIPVRRADGSAGTAAVSVAPVRDREGRVTASVAVITDVTPFKADKEALAAAQVENDRVIAARSRFLAGASHELRHPLQASILFAELLADHVTNPSGRELVTRLMQTLDAMRTMVDSILDVARLGSGVVTPQLTRFPLAELFTFLVESFQPRAAACGLSLRMVATRYHVVSDYELLGRLLEQLLDNALRYTTRGGILLGCRRRGANLCIVVADTGRGIPADRIDAVFDEFYRYDPPAGQARSLGLGLAQVRAAASVLGHRLTVRSQPGRGTIFEVDVPMAGCAPGPAA